MIDTGEKQEKLINPKYTGSVVGQVNVVNARHGLKGTVTELATGQFTECRSADFSRAILPGASLSGASLKVFEDLVRAGLPTERTISTQSLTPLSTDH